MATPEVFKGYTVSRAEPGADPEVRGKFGSVVEFDADTLAVFVVGSHRLRKLAKIDGASLFTEGEGEGTVHVPNAALGDAAAIIEARKRRALSDAAKDRLRQVGKASQFRKDAA